MKQFFSSVRKKELFVVLVLVGIAFFLRSVALYRDLFFGYDQGRDAFVMQEFRQGNFTLIGPTTGLEGVFLGPFYYYLLFPFYLIGDGNPMVAAFGFVGMHAILTGLLFFVGRRFFGMKAGLITAGLFAFSQTNIHFSRWIANPTPLPLFALTAFSMLWYAWESHKKWVLIPAGMLFGLCFQLEAANAMWFIPTVGLLVFLESWWGTQTQTARERFVTFVQSGLLLSAGFMLVSMPQVLFEFKHNFLTTRNVLVSFQQTHDITLAESLPKRLPWLFDLYAGAVFPKFRWIFGILAVFGVGFLLRHIQKLKTDRGIRVLLCWFFVPLFFHIIYTGNHGNFWDYYVIGQYPALFLLLGWMASVFLQKKSLRLASFVCISLLALSTAVNLYMWKGVFSPNPDRYSLEQQVLATNWIYDSAENKPFGVWVYTPSYQDQANRYVLWWVGRDRGEHVEENVEQQPLIYLFVEDDGQFWKRRVEWIEEKKKFGEVIDQKRFGALTIFKLRNTFLPSSVPKVKKCIIF